jgi:hypothetical protein
MSLHLPFINSVLKLKILIVLTFILGVSQSLLVAQSREDLVRKHITYLASDAMEGRAPGTKGEKMAQEYIVQVFKSYGLKPAGSKKYFQSFDYTERSHAHHAEGKGIERKGTNVIGYLDNKADKTIVIGAHYDHLGNEDGRGSSLAADPNGQIHNGADDNASGVAGLLELARIFSQNNKNENVNFLFMAYSAEEAGLIGSKFYTQNPVKPLNQVLCMLNMDMIGRLRDSTRSLIIGGVGTSPVWIPLVKKLNSEFELKFDTAGMGPSDHASFYLKDIPVLHFFSGTHSDYHKPSDDIEKINFPGEVNILNYIVKVVDSCARIQSIPFTKTKSNERKMTAFKVTLGIMADYSFGGPGVKVDGVSPEKPAEKAGILAGDMILKIGDFETADIYKYMEALGKFEKGQKTEIEIKRGNSVLKKEVMF